jgi:hypothetical protein
LPLIVAFTIHPESSATQADVAARSGRLSGENALFQVSGQAIADVQFVARGRRERRRQAGVSARSRARDCGCGLG